MMPMAVVRLMRYLLTGGTAAVVDLGGFGLLRWLQLPVIPAATCSFLAATVVNFLLSARFVFGMEATWSRYASFLAGTFGGLTANVAVTAVCMGRVGLSWVAGKAVGIAAGFFLNFWIHSSFVFRESGASGASNRRGAFRESPPA
jgi:putative flippase GtrA